MSKVDRYEADKSKGPVSLSGQLSDATLKPYAKAISLFHKRKFKEAQKAFKDFISKHGDDHPEITERAQIYVSICEKQLHPDKYVLKTFEDFFYGAIIEVNRGNCDKAIEYLKNAQKSKPKNDHVLYLLASTYALKQDAEKAAHFLKDAIELNDFNRLQALIDSDFDEIRSEETFAKLLS
jgi:TolA-binding protein